MFYRCILILGTEKTKLGDLCLYRASLWELQRLRRTSSLLYHLGVSIHSAVSWRPTELPDSNVCSTFGLQATRIVHLSCPHVYHAFHVNDADFGFRPLISRYFRDKLTGTGVGKINRLYSYLSVDIFVHCAFCF
jgi:hypothetical protein